MLAISVFKNSENGFRENPGANPVKVFTPTLQTCPNEC
jgi:hypothetical protein